MPSISIDTVREQSPSTDAEAAAKLAEKGEYVIIVRYKLKADGPFTSFGLCWTYAEADNYLLNQNLHEVEVLYDRGNTTQIFPKILHNPQAIKRNIIFEKDGRASEPCCWNCRHFAVILSNNHLAARSKWVGELRGGKNRPMSLLEAKGFVLSRKRESIYAQLNNFCIRGTRQKRDIFLA